MKAKFDFTKVQDDFEVLPKDDYVVYLFDVDLKKTRKGDDMYVLILKVAEGDYEGRQLFFNLPVMSQTMWKIKETLEAFGMEVPKGTVNIDFDELLGKKAVAEVDHQEYNGKEREDVRALSVYEGSGDDSGDPFEENEDALDISDDDVPF